MSDGLHRRARQQRSRIVVRRFEYRRRNTSAGVWYRLRRVLADARLAFVVSAEDAEALHDLGCETARVGAELVPEKSILWATEEQVSALPSAVRVPVRLGPELLGARHLALVRFD